jgi:hypothetical protein
MELADSLRFKLERPALPATASFTTFYSRKHTWVKDILSDEWTGMQTSHGSSHRDCQQYCAQGALGFGATPLSFRTWASYPLV